jgi:C4-dicarboxylate transporter, DctQ subunit
MIYKIGRHFEEGFLSILLVFMTLLVFMEVVLRFAFNTGINWAQEVTLHTSAWFVLFGISYGVKVGAHIGVDAVVRLLSPELKRICSIIAVALCLVYCVLILMGGWVYLVKIYNIGLSMDDTPTPWIFLTILPDHLLEILKVDIEDPILPMWIAHSPLFIGFVLLTYRFLEVGKKLLTGEMLTMQMADEAKEALHEAGIDMDKIKRDDEVEAK